MRTIGERGIRTPGAVRHNGFQDRRIKPLCHLSSYVYALTNSQATHVNAILIIRPVFIVLPIYIYPAFSTIPDIYHVLIIHLLLHAKQLGYVFVQEY
jgi:hypothetical protein